MSALKSHNPTNAIINRNFVIRVQKKHEKQTFLLSASKYKELIGLETANKHFKKVLNGGLDKYTFHLRSRLKIDFHGK